MKQVKIYSIKEIRNMDPEDIENYKVDVKKAQQGAATDFEKEPYINQLERINQVLNERETADQERGFIQLKQDTEEAIKYALAVEATI
jgi:hypothetical protein